MRSIQTSWYVNREWLEYSAQRNACYCLPCGTFPLLITEMKYLLIQDFRLWKTGTETSKGLNKHSSGKSHIQAKNVRVGWWCVKQEKKAVFQLS